jgi:hypothetical protein
MSHTLRLSSLGAALLTALLAGCGAPESSVSEAAAVPQMLTVVNGLTTNGLTKNGLTKNGLTKNGLTISTFNRGDFVAWFNADTALSSTVMAYIYRCAAPAGTSVAWTNPSTNVKYTWAGGLGLAPGWALGSAATVTEQQVVSACLAAHVNLYGWAVSISVTGRGATGVPIATTPAETSLYNIQEACWFGNLFAGEGVGFAFDTGGAGSTQSSTRACAFPSPNGVPSCSPIVNTGRYCWDICQRDGSAWGTCTWNGKSYASLTTHYRPQEISVCGDRQCQATEACGASLAPSSCSDCGACR